MLKVRWLATKAKGYTDIIPLHLIANEGDRSDVYHEIEGPRHRRSTAKCSIHVKDRIVIFDYGGKYKDENLSLDVEIGRMKVVFSDVTRRVIESVWWKDDGSEDYDEAPVSTIITEQDGADESDTVIGIEGAAILVSHQRREREPGLRSKKIRNVRNSGQTLRCEACKFDFDEVYGKLGESACEVHHRTALASGVQHVSLNDLAILCANCHRVIHRTNPMMDVPGFAEVRFQRDKVNLKAK